MREWPQGWADPRWFPGVLTQWGWMVIGDKCRLGQHTDIGAFTLIVAHEEVIIEDGVQIGAHCAIYSVNTINDTRGPVRIGAGARIGAFSLILPGMVIAPGAIIRARSTVK